MHVLTASPAHAQVLIRAAMTAGFRETGAVNLLSDGGAVVDSRAQPIVAIRTAGVAFESLLGFQDRCGRRAALTTPRGVVAMVDVAVERAAENEARRARFEDALFAALGKADGHADVVWEGTEERRKRKREEGLKRQQELRLVVRGSRPTDEDD